MTKPKTTQEDIQGARAGRTKNFFGEMAKLYAENGGTGNGMQSIEPIESDWSEGVSSRDLYDFEEGVGPKSEEVPQDVYDKVVSANESAQAAGDMFEKMMEETIAKRENPEIANDILQEAIDGAPEIEERIMELLETHAPAKPKTGYARVTAGERTGPFHPDWETGGWGPEDPLDRPQGEPTTEEGLKKIGAHPSQQRTLPAMNIDAETEPGGMTDEERVLALHMATRILQRQREAQAQARARGQTGGSAQPELPPDTEPEPEPHDPDESLDEARNYQGKYIGYPNDPKAPKADLEKWKSKGDSWGAHDDYEGTGYDLITIDTPDDPDGVPKRQFLEDPETGEVINITGMLPPDTDEHTAD